ncbi:NADH/Ubiquinone/plastoquinone (complex I) [Geobacter metallireducens RCH3]|uniref:Ech-hydrogenase-related complex, HyfF-like integral membrane subunit n=1 Tax=Geobacter metallireducens (strain ATCC 53774 / DSM 7210 / GS-15) TaxID=269799 RepID=Q39YQ9_GEOMG|nr:proton-conducting transporter membrane subunit [Geobacter metallireducens]ABB30615.1 Ech-hydrogenase-related complex, HyfF-like integral membrane subunit [Geobacter metallireducens GS-15]EHP88002.1 NADH/Ubiquinone/plastoquinone (complex I) [Geobacter metallireducens RCH3]
MITGILLIPLLGAITAWLIPSDRSRPWVLPVVGTLHLALTIEAALTPTSPSVGMWLHLDAIGKLVLLSVSLLFFASGLYAVEYLAYRRERPNRLLCAMLPVCLSAMTLVAFAHHLGLLWVAIETTTLTMTPLLYFNRNARSIEATWKYMLICSVGIALALLGLLFLAYSTVVARIEPTLLLEPLVANARLLSPAWLKAAFVFLLVGYGTKMGLAPLHTWKPDAYGEAPGLVGGLLAGGLVTCSFVGLLRAYQVCVAANGTTFHRDALVLMGLLSMATAAVFMARQADFKRMLAYSSVEHVGILAVALGLGKGALAGALLHLVNNSLTKGVLFLAAANIHRSYNSKRCEQVRGALRRLPWSGGLFLAGFFAVTGSPPFGLFVSEFSIISSAMTQGGEWIGGLILFFLAAIFLGMARTVLPVVMGESSRIEHTGYRDRFLTVVPPLILMGVVLMLGIWIPEPLSRLITEGAALLGGNVP